MISTHPPRDFEIYCPFLKEAIWREPFALLAATFVSLRAEYQRYVLPVGIDVHEINADDLGVFHVSLVILRKSFGLRLCLGTIFYESNH